MSELSYLGVAKLGFLLVQVLMLDENNSDKEIDSLRLSVLTCHLRHTYPASALATVR